MILAAGGLLDPETRPSGPFDEMLDGHSPKLPSAGRAGARHTRRLDYSDTAALVAATSLCARDVRSSAPGVSRVEPRQSCQGGATSPVVWLAKVRVSPSRCRSRVSQS
jgi:hypothetical protein